MVKTIKDNKKNSNIKNNNKTTFGDSYVLSYEVFPPSKNNFLVVYSVKFSFAKKANLTVGYDKFDVDGNDDGVDIFNANLYGKFGKNFGLGALYMHTSSDNKNIIAKGASKNGFVVTADIAGANFNKPGSWGLQGKYYHAPAGSAVSHTMTSTAAGDWFNEGYKGYSVGANYTVAKGMMFGVTWYDLKSRATDKKDKTLWGEFQLRF